MAMVRFTRTWLAFLFVICIAPLAQAQNSEETTHLAQIFARGQLIYALDQAAWHATDAMRERTPDPNALGLRGWIVEPHGGQSRVTFFGVADNIPYPLMVFDVVGETATLVSTTPLGAHPALTQLQSRMARALMAAREASLDPCTPAPFNTVVIPPANDADSVEVYLLSPQVTFSEIPFGGHYLLRIRADGSVDSQRAFTNSCINLPVQDGAQALMITHMLDPTPTEIHVFSMFAARMPIYVGTSQTRKVWAVESTGIREVRR